MAFTIHYIFCTVLFEVLARGTHGIPLQPSDPKPFIVGGEDAPEAYAPYMAALVFGSRVMSHSCGGSLISKVSVLTAAHCVDPFQLEDGSLIETFHIRVGSNQWNSGGTIVNIKDYYMHPKYDPNNIKYDAAVLVTKEEMVLTKNVALIRLAFDVVAKNENCLVTGWGRTGPRLEGNVLNLQPTPDDLQVLYMNTMAHEQCQEQMAEVSGGRAPPIQNDIEICTFHSRGHGMCFGDSGSALVRQGSREQVGIVSWGYNCALGAPDVYVRTSGIKDFLEPFLNLNED